MAGAVATTGAPATPPADTTPAADATPPADATVPTLPPYAMVLDRRLSADIARLPLVQQARRLRTRAMGSRDPDRFVELGTVLQVLGDLTSARFSYQSALRLEPGNVAAQVGLAVVDGPTGPEGLDRSAERLQAVAADHPDDQLVSFNQGWLDLYRRRGASARAALERTVALGPTTRLGRTAATLLTASDEINLGLEP